MFLVNKNRTYGYDERFLNRLATVLEQTLRILTQFNDARLVFDTCSYPAATNMQTRKVTIDRDLLVRESELKNRVRLAKGLLYHESGHLFWSLDAAGMDDLRQFASNNGFSGYTILGSYNEIEDKRIENHFVARYAPAKAYLAVPLAKLILGHHLDDLTDRQLAAVWLSAVGRPWLGTLAYRKLRAYVVSRLDTLLPSLVGESESIVAEYLTLSRDDVRSYGGRGHQLILQWHKLHDLLNEEVVGGCGGDNPMEKLGSNGRRDYDDDKLTKDDALSGEEAAEAINPSDDAEDADADNPNGDAGDGDSDSDTGAGEESSSGSNEAGDSSETSSSTGTSSNPPSADEVMGDVEEAMDEAEAEITADVDDTLDAIFSRIDEVDESLPSSKKQLWRTGEYPVTSTMQVVSRHISTELQAIRTEAASEWLRGTDVGRLNPMREEFFGDERLDVFDLFDEGTEDDMRCHVVFGIDQSFSMNTRRDGADNSDKPYQAAAKVAWIFREAFGRLDHVVDIYGYDDKYQRLDEPHRRLGYPVRNPSGGTEPLSMLKDMTRMSLAKKDVSDRLMVVLTDGSWGVVDDEDHERYANVVRNFRKAGGTAVLFVLESNETPIFTAHMSSGVISEDQPYGFNEWHLIQEPMDLVDPVRAFVKQLMTSHLRGR